jgi:hypothetical protein
MSVEVVVRRLKICEQEAAKAGLLQLASDL